MPKKEYDTGFDPKRTLERRAREAGLEGIDPSIIVPPETAPAVPAAPNQAPPPGFSFSTYPKDPAAMAAMNAARAQALQQMLRGR